nr:ABC transporter permease [Oscillatoria laete-virens]
MLWAFQLNLTALSLLSLVVGMFLIYNTTTTAVVRRRAELGILRAVGCPASTVRNLILCEAALQGAVGAVAGWFLGITLADGLTGAVSQTIQSLYIASSVASAHVPWTLAPVVFAVTLAAVLLSAWAPAREAAQIAPVESFSEGHLHLKSSVDKMKHFEIGLAICVLSGLCALGAVWFYPPLGFLSALSLTLGVAFFCPLLLDGFCRGLSAFCLNRGQWLPALAARSCSFALNRTSVAVASLMAALSMMVGVSIMIHSFRGTVDSWIAQTVKADIIVSPASQLVSGPGTGLDPAMVEALRKDPAIRLVDTYSEMRLAHEGETIKVAGTALRQIPEQGNLRLLDTSAQKLAAALTPKNARSPAPRKALVSDVFARKFGVNPGDKLTLTFPSGPVTLEIVSRYRDYTTELGVALMDAALMRELTGSYHPHSLGLYLRDSSQAPAVRDRLLAQFAPRGELLVLANAELKDKILVIFDQTFAVTTILRSMALIIAGLGIFQTLTVLVTEQTRALGILRAVGCPAAGIQRLVFWEAGILGTVAAFLGIAAGIVLSLILCYVINLAFFRWTIEWSLPPGLLAGVWPAVLIVACLAAWLPARRAARLQISTCVKNQ